MIIRLLFPLIKKFRKLILSMVGVSCLGIAMMTGLSGAYRTLDVSLSRYVEDYRYADVLLYTSQADAAVERHLAAVPGVSRLVARLVADVPVRLGNGRLLSVRAFSYGADDFQDFYIRDRQESDQYPNLYVEYKFAEDNGLCVGDTVEVRVGDEYRTANIGAIVSSVECLSVFRDAYSWGENADFGYLFAPDTLAYGSELYHQYNQFLIRVTDDADPAAVRDAAQAVLEADGIDVHSAMLYEDSPVYQKIDINLQPIRTLSLLIPAVFFLNMIAVISLFLSQIIHQCRRDIGILRAFGFRKGHIRALYCIMTLCITLVASVIGLGIGYWLMHFAGEMYGDFFALPHLFFRMDGDYVVLAAVATVFFGQVAALISTAKLSSIMPSEAMSREAPADSRLPVPVQKLTAVLSPTMKFGITSALRNRKRFVFSTFCVAVSITLILTSLSFYVSKNSILTDLYDRRTHFDAQVFLNAAATREEITSLEALDGVTDVQGMTYAAVDLSANGHTVEATLCGLSVSADAVQVFDSRGDRVAVPAEGLLLERHAAEELDVRAGDVVRLGQTDITVVALSDQSVDRVHYVSDTTMETLAANGWVEVDKYTLLCRCTDETALLDCVSDWDDYAYTNFTGRMREGNEKTFATYTLGVYIIIAFAVFLGLLIVFNTTQMNLFEQKKSLSVIRTLGFYVSDISRMWLLQTLLQFVLSCAIGLPVGVAVAKYALAQMATDGREYPFVAHPLPFLLTAGIVLVYILFSHLAAMRSIQKWDLVENIKEKE